MRDRWKILYQFIQLSPKKQRHYIFSETSKFQDFYANIIDKKKKGESDYNWYTILNVLDDISRLVKTIPDSYVNEKGKTTSTASEKDQIAYIVKELYTAKFKKEDKGNFSRPAIMLFAPPIGMKEFGNTLKTKYTKWFQQVLHQDIENNPNPVRTFAFQVLLAIFNSDENKEATYFNIFVGDKSAREGLSLNLMKNVYFLKIPKKMSTFKQVVGRATRYCNFKQEPDIKEWKVRPYLLFYSPTDTRNFEKLLSRKEDIMSETLDFLRIISVDCYLFGPLTHRRDEDYSCGTKGQLVKRGDQLLSVGSGSRRRLAMKEEPKEQPPFHLCIDFERGIMYTISKNLKRICSQGQSQPVVSIFLHDYNEVDGFVEVYSLTKLFKSGRAPSGIFKQNEGGQVEVQNDTALQNYLRTPPLIYIAIYDSLPSGSSSMTPTQKKDAEKYLNIMLPNLYCSPYSTFSYLKLYESLEKLPLDYLRAWLRILYHKIIKYTKEQQLLVKQFRSDGRKRLELFNYQNFAATHLVHLKKFLAQYPTLIAKEGKPVAVGLQTAKAPPPSTVPSEHVLSGQAEIDYLLTDHSLKPSTAPQEKAIVTKHGEPQIDEYSQL